MDLLSLQDPDAFRELVGEAHPNFLDLYVWNARISGAFFELLADVEVILRGSIHRVMVEWSESRNEGRNWFEDKSGMFDERSRHDVTRAVERIGGPLEDLDPDRIVSELSFGFWRFLLSGKYRGSLWAQATRHGFPYLAPQDSRAFSKRVGRLHDLRNRIAHHRPIHYRRLDLDLYDCYAVLGAVSPEAEDWAKSRSRVEGILRLRP